MIYQELACLTTDHADLLGNETMQRKHETCPKRKQWWNEAYILCIEVNKLMILEKGTFLLVLRVEIWGKVTFY